MGMYVCEKCGYLENSALSVNFWIQWAHKEHPQLCVECDTGSHHDCFVKRKWDGVEEIINKNNTWAKKT